MDGFRSVRGGAGSLDRVSLADVVEAVRSGGNIVSGLALRFGFTSVRGLVISDGIRPFAGLRALVCPQKPCSRAMVTSRERVGRLDMFFFALRLRRGDTGSPVSATTSELELAPARSARSSGDVVR